MQLMFAIDFRTVSTSTTPTAFGNNKMHKLINNENRRRDLLAGSRLVTTTLEKLGTKKLFLAP